MISIERKCPSFGEMKNENQFCRASEMQTFQILSREEEFQGRWGSFCFCFCFLPWCSFCRAHPQITSSLLGTNQTGSCTDSSSMHSFMVRKGFALSTLFQIVLEREEFANKGHEFCNLNVCVSLWLLSFGEQLWRRPSVPMTAHHEF